MAFFSFPGDPEPGQEYTEFVGREGMGRSPVEKFAFPEPPDVRCRTRKVYDMDWQTRVSNLPAMLGTQGRKDGPFGPYISRTPPWPHRDWYVSGAAMHLPNVVNPPSDDEAEDDEEGGDDGEASGTVAPTSPYLWCNSVEIQGYGVNTTFLARGDKELMKSPWDTAVYETARCMLEFVALPFRCFTDKQMNEMGFNDQKTGGPDEASLQRYVTIYPKPKGQYLNLGGVGGIGGSGGFKYTQNPPNNLGNNGVIGAPGRILPSWDLAIRHWRVPFDCCGSILINPLLQQANSKQGQLGPLDTTPGKVNISPFRGLPPGTVLYLPPEFVVYMDPFGLLMVDVIHYFEFLPTGQNNVPAFINNGAGPEIAFVEISTDGTSYPYNQPPAQPPPAGKHVYDTADFAPLFRPPI